MNRKIVYTTIILLLFLMISIGLTYAFYVPQIQGVPTTNTTAFSNKNIEVNYIDGADILIDSTHPTVTKNITITNNTANEIDYFIKFSDIQNNLVDEELDYSYTCTGEGCESRNNLYGPTINENITLLVAISPNVTHTYTINFSYSGTGDLLARIEVIKPAVLISRYEKIN